VIADTFGISSLIIPGPVTGIPLCVPRPELPARPGEPPAPEEKAKVVFDFQKSQSSL
jgi:hypothetical protein